MNEIQNQFPSWNAFKDHLTKHHISKEIISLSAKIQKEIAKSYGIPERLISHTENCVISIHSPLANGPKSVFVYMQLRTRKINMFLSFDGVQHRKGPNIRRNPSDPRECIVALASNTEYRPLVKGMIKESYEVINA